MPITSCRALIFSRRGPVDSGRAGDRVLRLDLLRLAVKLLADLLLARVHDLQLFDAELLEGLGADLLRLVLGLVEDELRHLEDLVLGLTRGVHGGASSKAGLPAAKTKVDKTIACRPRTS